MRADSPPGSRADPTRFGREGGWKARYKRSGSPRTRGALVVESRLDLFESDGGAQDDLDAYESQFEASIQGAVAGRLLRVSGLGDRALAITFRQGTPPFATRFFTIAWREANVTASVSVNGFDGKVSKQDALALARKQQRRIARALS